MPPDARTDTGPLCFLTRRILLLFELARLSLALKCEEIASACLSDLQSVDGRVRGLRRALGEGRGGRAGLKPAAGGVAAKRHQLCRGAAPWQEGAAHAPSLAALEAAAQVAASCPTTHRRGCPVSHSVPDPQPVASPMIGHLRPVPLLSQKGLKSAFCT